MPTSHELTGALRVASDALHRDPCGDLPLPARKAIWAAMGPRVIEEGKPVMSAGLKRRLRLAMLAAERVLPVWMDAFPASQDPQDMLSIAEKWLSGHADFKTAWQLRNAFWSELGQIQSVEVAAGFAACQAVATALNDERFSEDDLHEPHSDQQLDLSEWDAGFYASIAHAGSAPWEPTPSAARRRAYWQWYLAEAVPRAWGGY